MLSIERTFRASLHVSSLGSLCFGKDLVRFARADPRKAYMPSREMVVKITKYKLTFKRLSSSWQHSQV